MERAGPRGAGNRLRAANELFLPIIGRCAIVASMTCDHPSWRCLRVQSPELTQLVWPIEDGPYASVEKLQRLDRIKLSTSLDALRLLADGTGRAGIARLLRVIPWYTELEFGRAPGFVQERLGIDGGRGALVISPASLLKSAGAPAATLPVGFLQITPRGDITRIALDPLVVSWTDDATSIRARVHEILCQGRKDGRTDINFQFETVTFCSLTRKPIYSDWETMQRIGEITCAALFRELVGQKHADRLLVARSLQSGGSDVPNFASWGLAGELGAGVIAGAARLIRAGFQAGEVLGRSSGPLEQAVMRVMAGVARSGDVRDVWHLSRSGPSTLDLLQAVGNANKTAEPPPGRAKPAQRQGGLC